MTHIITPRIQAISRAKVNLSLEILGKRKDGYHELETIMQSVDLYDELDMTFDDSGELEITCSDPDIPVDSSNICARAVELMVPLTGTPIGGHIHIDKNIPHSAGLGGGSSNAAAVILGIREAFGLDIPGPELEAIAARIGSDVPFMLYGGTMLARGRGEQLTRLETVSGGHFLIVKPSVDISTADVYKNVNLTLTRHRYRINLKQVNTLLARIPHVRLTFRNVLEDIVCPSYPQVSEALGELIASRPSFASMTGSGSGLFAIYESGSEASDNAGKFSADGLFTAVAVPTTRAVDLFPAESR